MKQTTEWKRGDGKSNVSVQLVHNCGHIATWKAQRPRCITVKTSLASQKLTGSKACLLGQVASFPTPVKHAAVVEVKNVTLLKKWHSKQQGPPLPPRDGEWEDRAVIREELWDLLTELPSLRLPPPPLPSPSLNCFHLFSFFFRRLVLCFFAQISWLYESGRKEGGGARTADGENLGEKALAFFASLCSLFT